jgi:hypothetical protein
VKSILNVDEGMCSMFFYHFLEMLEHEECKR